MPWNGGSRFWTPFSIFLYSKLEKGRKKEGEEGKKNPVRPDLLGKGTGGKKEEKKLSKNGQKLSKKCQKTVKKLSKSCHKVQKVVKKLSKSCHKFVKICEIRKGQEERKIEERKRGLS
jgi:hypothetical protein